ncbi:MAG: hypothetical protein J6M24_07000 [Lachnospiraceae bacterium]|nr:hypothetical protein [Lachnospiraceae bacterium]
MKKNLFIAIAFLVLFVSCGPDKKTENEKEEEISAYGEITRLSANSLGIIQYGSNGEKLYDESILAQYGASLYASYSENCVVFIDGEKATIDKLELGMSVKLYNKLGVNETFPEQMNKVYKIEAFTIKSKS